MVVIVRQYDLRCFSEYLAVFLMIYKTKSTFYEKFNVNYRWIPHEYEVEGPLFYIMCEH